MEKKKGKNRSALSKSVRVVLLAAAAALTLFILFFAVKVLSLDAWHAFDPDKITGASRTLVIYDRDGAEMTRLDAGEDRVWIPIDAIPLHVQKAFISAEDARYYDHPGIDIIRILGAAWEDLKAGSYVQGASTITQQLIKLSHLTSAKTMSRKLEEAVLAYQMEKQYSKDEILEMYLNYVYFGRGYYGVEAAALGYFGIHANELTLAQGASLAAVLKSPSKYAPHIAPDACRKRRDNVLSLMHEYGYIDELQETQAKQETLSVLAEKKASRGFYVDTALLEAAQALNTDMDTLLTGGFKIYTCADTALQAYCESLFAQGDEELFPSVDCEGAAVILRVEDASVAALIGGRDTDAVMAFNRATDIRRQPGSVIKPVLVYGPALEYEGLTASSAILDERTSFADYSPRNYNDKYYGWVTLRESVKRSLNIPAVKLMEQIGVESCKRFASYLGVEFDEEDTSLTLALGGFTYGVSPLQMAGAYACFANSGIYSKPYLVERITDDRGTVIYEHAASSAQVMSEENAFILTNMLQSAISEGTGRRLGELSLGLAGKTGTVGGDEGNRDAWMAAYNPEYSACVWLGYDSAGEGALPKDASGGKYPALILAKVFSHIYESSDAPLFDAPEGVVEVRLDAHTLATQHESVLANAFTPQSSILKEYFVRGSEPRQTTSYWAVPAAAGQFQVEAEPLGLPKIRFIATDENAVYKLYRTDAAGNTTLLKQWAGNGSNVSYEDITALSGVYTYYVVPEHKELVVNGKRVLGPSSAKLYINLTSYPGLSESAGGEELELEDSEFDLDEDAQQP